MSSVADTIPAEISGYGLALVCQLFFGFGINSCWSVMCKGMS